MKAPVLPAAASALLLIASCGPFEDVRSYANLDLRPPTLLAFSAEDAQSLTMRFDEPTLLQEDSLSVSPALELSAPLREAEEVRLAAVGQQPGRQYVLEGVAEDLRGNSTNFLLRFYGHNDAVPKLLINEFTCRGSSAHPDKVELKAVNGGNLSAVTLYNGTPDNHEDRLIFPELMLGAGDFLVVHFKPQGIPEEIDETGSKSESAGLDACDTAYDFWMAGATGLGNNNGVLCLTRCPGGTVLDAVLYSNRTSDSDERYLGFGTRDTLERALELAERHGWVAEGDRIRPEDAVNPEGSTATRSICRRSAADTNTRADWYIVPTRQASFGEDNSAEIYVP